MKTKHFACEGPVCRPEIPLLSDGMKPEYRTINFCIANLVDDKWVLPPGWYNARGEIHCPRCMRERYPDSKLNDIEVLP